MNFTCKSCSQPTFTKDAVYITKKGTCQCKKCHSQMVMNKVVQKKILAFPQNFLECNDCDRIFSYRKSGGATVFNPDRTRTECPFCSSENIDDLIRPF